MDHLQATDRLGRVVETFASAFEQADSTAPVPTCPGWTVAKLAKHVGLTHRWATEMVRDRATERLDMRRVELGWPDDAAAVADWLRAGAERLANTLRAADGDATMWAWGTDQHVRFWSRRVVHEGLVHTADLDHAVGNPMSYPDDLAADAVDELLDNLPSAAAWSPDIAALRGAGESIHLHSTDVDGEWMIELDADGFAWHHGHGKGTVAVRAAAADLVLLLYGRRALSDERFNVFGEVAVLERWLAHSAI